MGYSLDKHFPLSDMKLISAPVREDSVILFFSIYYEVIYDFINISNMFFLYDSNYVVM